jgi:hypothetical protein
MTYRSAYRGTYRGTLENPNLDHFNSQSTASREENVKNASAFYYGKDHIAASGCGVYCTELDYQFFYWGQGGYEKHNYNNSDLGTWVYPRHIKTPTQPRSKTMNLSSAVFLIDDRVRAISVIYEPKPKSGHSMPPNSYTFKSLDKDIKEGDYVIIPSESRHMMAVAQVHEVDVEIDFTDTHIDYKWIMARIDLTAHAKVAELEQIAFDTIKKAERKKAKDELKASIEAFQDESLQVTALEDLSKKVKK